MSKHTPGPWTRKHPEPESNPGKTHYQGDDCPGGHASVCGYCGAPCPTCLKCPHGAREYECPVLGCRNYFNPNKARKPEPCGVQECIDLGQCACFREPLLLGHEFVRCRVEADDPYCPPDECCCGQPREAH